MSSSEAEQLKVDLREAYEHGDLNLSDDVCTCTACADVGRALRSCSAFGATAGVEMRLGIDLLRWIVRYGGAIERTTSRHGLGHQLESKKPCGSPKYSVVRQRRRRRTRYSIWRSQSRTGE